MTSRYEEALRDWPNREDLGDDIHRHFEDIQGDFREWPDVAEEGLRLRGVMFGRTVGDEGPEMDLLCGVAAAAYHLAINQVAAKLGVGGFAVMCALEGQEKEGGDGFVAECQKWDKPAPPQGPAASQHVQASVLGNWLHWLGGHRTEFMG